MVNKTPAVTLVVSAKFFYRLRVVGKNGKTMFHSETYFNKANAKRAGVAFHRATGFPFIDTTTIRSK